jgi:formylglycine-generating enzyme required for sulfatase activity
MEIADGRDSTNARGNVTWLEAVDFCNRLSKREKLPPYYKIDGKKVTAAGGCGYRLPSLLEWDYAASAGDESNYAPDGKGRESFGWTGHYYKGTRPVGVANQFGLNKISGNWEYVDAPRGFRMWCDPDKPNKLLINNGPEHRASDIGFRVVRDAAKPAG